MLLEEKSNDEAAGVESWAATACDWALAPPGTSAPGRISDSSPKHARHAHALASHARLD